MNKRIKDLNIEEYLFLDGEMIRGQKDLDINSNEFNLFQYKNRDRVTSELLTDQEVVDLYKKTAALSPVYGKIVCISVGFIKDTNLYIKAIVGEEDYVISEYFKILSKFKGTIGYNSLRFDVPYIRIRAYANGVHTLLEDKYSDSDAKPWEVSETHIDVMDAIKGSSYNTLSLEEACYLFGISSSKDDISGSEVSDVFYSEGVYRVAKYCNKDVIALVRLFCKISGREEIGEIIIRDEEISQQEPELTIFQRLMKSGVLSEEIKSEFREILSDCDDNELQKASVLIKAHYLIPKGGKKENKAREEEVDLLIQEISNANYERRK